MNAIFPTSMPSSQPRISPLTLLLGWFFLLGGLLLVVLQPSSGVDLKYHWASSALVVSAGCYWSMRMPARLAFPASLLWLCAVGMATLSVVWSSAQTDGSVIAGLLPYSDAFGYFSDAQRILAGEPISSFSSRRPLFAAWMAGLLALTGNDLPRAMALMTIAVAIPLALAVWALGRNRTGVAIVVVFTVVVWLYYRRFIGTTLTEHLGLSLGLLAFGFLWHGAHSRSEVWMIMGMFMLTLALNARAGTFIVLPTLALWIGVAFATEGRRFSWKMFCFCVAAVVVAFSGNRLLLTALGGIGSAAFSNLSYSLYGLVMGGDWTLAQQQHPELAKMLPDAQAQEVYRLAFEHFLAHPLSLLFGAIRAWAVFSLTAFSFAGSYQPYSPGFLGSYILSLAAAVGLLFIWRDRRQREIGMVIATLTGIFFSIPFVPPWDADSMRAYAATLPFIALIPAWGVGRMLGVGDASPTAPQAPQSTRLALGFLLIVVFSCFLLPLAGRGTQATPSIPMAINCPTSQAAAIVKVIPGTFVRIESGGAGISLELKSLLFRDPFAAMHRLGASLLSNAIPVGRLDLNAATGHAPELAVEFIRSLQDGQALAVAMLRYPDNKLRIATVLFGHVPEQITLAEMTVCAEVRVGKVSEIRIP